MYKNLYKKRNKRYKLQRQESTNSSNIYKKIESVKRQKFQKPFHNNFPDLSCMTTSQLQDRPINPNKEYLQQKQQQYKQKKQIHEYLKKHQLHDQVLPCFRNNYVHVKQHRKKTSENKKSKAEIYEEIKKKNIEKFGDKKQEKSAEKQDEIRMKKIDPLKMTISYKPKNVAIDTNEYKLKSDKKDQQVQKSHVKDNSDRHINNFEQTAKQKYEKLLQMVRKQKIELNQEKENFQKHKEKLQFKKLIEKQNSVPFLDEIKRQIYQKKKSQLNHKVECKVRKQNEESQEKYKQEKTKKHQQDLRKETSNKPCLSEIQSRIVHLQQQKQQLQQEVYQNKRQIIDPSNVICKKYSIQQVNQIPNFNVECFGDYIDLKTLLPQANEFYQIAIKVFQTGLNVKQAKIKLKVDSLDVINENSNNALNSGDYKRRFQGQTRITKYNNGWIQVWTPGVQRLMANKQLSYKVIWLKNGDIKQEWKEKRLQSYYSKEKDVVQVKLGKFEPIYFFVQLNQLQQYNSQKGMKTVMFRDGRVESFSTGNSRMNGFSV